MSSSLVILFGVVDQFGRFGIWSETGGKIPAEYGPQHNSTPPPTPPPQTPWNKEDNMERTWIQTVALS